MSKKAFDTAITQARDLLRWRSPLRTELWAARLTAELEAPGRPDESGPDHETAPVGGTVSDEGSGPRADGGPAGGAGQARSAERVPAFLRRLAENGGPEARLTLAALSAVNGPVEAARNAEPAERTDTGETTGQSGPGAVSGPDHPGGVGRPYSSAGEGMAGSLAGWVRRMGRVTCDGAWYGKADPYGEQVLAVLSFRYGNGKEPHVLVVGIDQPNGPLAVDALVEEAKFLDDLGLREASPGVVAGRILDAFELGDRIMGAAVAGTLSGVRPFALARALAVPGAVRGAADDTVAGFQELPDLPGAEEAFGALAEFVGDRPLWWSPARASRFLTRWLPREALLTDEAIAAMPEVVRAWSRYHGDLPEVLRQVDADAPGLPLLMADDSLASLNKRLARAARTRPGHD